MSVLNFVKNHKKITVIALVAVLAVAAIAFFIFSSQQDYYLPYMGVNASSFTIIRHGHPREVQYANGNLPKQITIGADGVTGSVHPLNAITAADILASNIIFEPLLAISPTGHVKNNLVESFEVSEDETTYTFLLKENVTFSDGTPLTPSIVKQSFLTFSHIGAETVHTPHLNRISGFSQFRFGIADDIYGIVPNDEYNTISFTFDIATGNNIWAFLTPIIYNDLGTGPFVMDGFDGEVVALSANAQHHNGRPLLDHVFIRSANLASAPLLLELGNIDLFWSDYNENLFRQLEFSPHLSIGVFNGNQQGYIGFNFNNPKLANPNIRKALALSSNVTAVTEDLFGYFAQGGSPIVPNYFWLSNADSYSVPFDLEQAVALIEAEGYSLNASNIFENSSGETLAFTLYTINSESAWLLSESIAANWREIGIQVIVQTLSFSNMREAAESGDFDMMYLTMRIDFDTDFTSFTDSDALVNPFRWHNAEAADFATQINNANMHSAITAFNSWRQIYENEHIRLHVDRPNRIVFFNPSLTGLYPYGFGLFTWNIAEWDINVV